MDGPQARELVARGAVLVDVRSGIQSARAAKELAAMGFTHVYDLGPMFGWRHGAGP